MQTVRFNHMADGTKEDYDLLARCEEEQHKTLSDRVLVSLMALEDSYGGYKVSRFEHSLQTATRAERDGRDEEYVVAALLHDIGDVLAPYSHGELAASVLRPFVSEELHWIVKYHPVFQLYYYGHHTGEDQFARERFRGEKYYDACVEFCELYDQTSFDPDYASMPFGHFESIVRDVFAEPRYLQSETV